MRQARAFASIAPAVFKPSGTEDFLWKYLHNLKPETVSLTEPMPGLPAIPVNPVPAAFPTLTTTLSNGVQVASEDAAGLGTSLGVFVDMGSRLEDIPNSGSSHFLQHLAFKSTANRSHQRLVRDVENIGANTAAIAGRENIIYSGESLRMNAPHLLEIMADSILNSSITNAEFEQVRSQVKSEIEEVEKNAQTLVLEHLHSAAYSTGIGAPLLCPSYNIGALSRDAVLDFRQRNLLPGRIVVSASGMPHDELVALTENLFGGLTGSNARAAYPKSEYKGGDARLGSAASPDTTTVALGFEGVSWKDEDLLAVCTLHTLMGGGGSFSAGGPGKGMYSRLYRNVLNRYEWVQSATAFNTAYSDSGLFGIVAQSDPAHAGDLVAVMCRELAGMATTIDDADLARAKNQTRSSVLMNLESRAVSFEDIGRQMLAYGKREGPKSLCDKIAALTPADIKRVAAKMVATPVSVSAHGDLSFLPRYDEIARQF